MKEAKLKSNINRILVAGTDVVLTHNDFDLYENGALSSASRGSGETFTGLAVAGPIFAESSSSTLTLHVAKHARSTSYADDVANGHWNTSDDDLGDVQQLGLIGTLTHPTAGAFDIFEIIYYCPAVYPPNISISRMAAVMRNASTSYSGIYGNAQINELSPSRPDKVASYRASELIGYSPKYTPCYINTSPVEVRIKEGKRAATVTRDVYINQDAGVTEVVALGVNCPVDRAKQVVSTSLSEGTYQLSNRATISGITYVYPSVACTILPPLITITPVSIQANTSTGELIFTVNNTLTDKTLVPVIKMVYKYLIPPEINEYIGSTSKTYPQLILPAGQQGTYSYGWDSPSLKPEGYSEVRVSYQLRNLEGDVLVESFVDL